MPYKRMFPDAIVPNPANQPAPAVTPAASEKESKSKVYSPKKSCRFEIRMSQKEKDKLSALQAKWKLSSKSDVILKLLSVATPKAPETEADYDKNLLNALSQFRTELNSIGNNINQIAHKANSSGLTSMEMNSLQQMTDEFNQIMEGFTQAISNELGGE